MPKKAVPTLIGAKVVKVRQMTESEAEQEGWEFGRHGACTVIEFDNGIKVYPSCDPEGNSEGCLFGRYKGDGIYIMEE